MWLREIDKFKRWFRLLHNDHQLNETKTVFQKCSLTFVIVKTLQATKPQIQIIEQECTSASNQQEDQKYDINSSVPRTPIS